MVITKDVRTSSRMTSSAGRTPSAMTFWSRIQKKRRLRIPVVFDEDGTLVVSAIDIDLDETT